MNKEDFGKFIKELRINKGYTQKELAEKLFLDVSTISKWERGVSFPDITLIPNICNILEVDEHELIKCSSDLNSKRLKEEGLKFIKIKNKIFYTVTFLYVLALIICFIVNLSVNHKLSWFFIVFFSILCAFTFFPGVSRFIKKDKLITYILSTFLSLSLLFIVCSFYSKTNWFLIAISSMLLGYFLIFYPIIYFKKIVYLNENYLDNKRFFMITYSIMLLILTIVLLLIINLYKSININTTLITTIYCFSILIVYGLVSLIKCNKYFKLGIDLILSGVYLIGLDKLLNNFYGENGIDYYSINFSDWKNCINANVAFIILMTLVILGIVFIIFGFKKRKNNLPS